MTARRAIEAFSRADHARFLEIQDFIRDHPRPIRGSPLVRPSRLFGKAGYIYFDEVFPYEIFYSLDDDDDIVIGLLMRAFTG